MSDTPPPTGPCTGDPCTPCCCDAVPAFLEFTLSNVLAPYDLPPGTPLEIEIDGHTARLTWPLDPNRLYDVGPFRLTGEQILRSLPANRG